MEVEHPNENREREWPAVPFFAVLLPPRLCVQTWHVSTGRAKMAKIVCEQRLQIEWRLEYSKTERLSRGCRPERRDPSPPERFEATLRRQCGVMYVSWSRTTLPVHSKRSSAESVV